MDWAVTARTGTPHVREMDADRELCTWLLVDATPSMDFGTAELEKRELAVAATAAVGFLTAGAGNRLGAYVVGATGIRRLPARTGRAHLLGLLRGLLAAPRAAADGALDGGAGGGADGGAGGGLVEAATTLSRSTQRRGLVVVVSDFLDGLPDSFPDGRLDGLPPGAPDRAAGAPAWEQPLRRLAARHQVLAVEVVDPRELELPDVGLITLMDPETGRRREIYTGDRRLRARYAEAAADQRRLIGDALRRTGAAHLVLRTDRDWIADIVRHVRIQRRLAGAARPPAGRRNGSAAVGPDSTVVNPDSSGAGPGPIAVGPDSTAVASERGNP